MNSEVAFESPYLYLALASIDDHMRMISKIDCLTYIGHAFARVGDFSENKREANFRSKFLDVIPDSHELLKCQHRLENFRSFPVSSCSDKINIRIND